MSSDLNSPSLRAGDQKPSLLPNPNSQETDTYLVSTTDGKGIAVTTEVNAGKSSGSEESRREKKLPEGKGACDSHPRREGQWLELEGPGHPDLPIP